MQSAVISIPGRQLPRLPPLARHHVAQIEFQHFYLFDLRLKSFSLVVVLAAAAAAAQFTAGRRDASGSRVHRLDARISHLYGVVFFQFQVKFPQIE